jgi:hypothetical protein
MVPAGKKLSKTAAFCWLASLVLLPPYMRNTTKKILIADNNDACRESLGVSIKGLGYEALEAATGPEAIDKGFQHASQSNYDGSTHAWNEWR